MNKTDDLVGVEDGKEKKVDKSSLCTKLHRLGHGAKKINNGAEREGGWSRICQLMAIGSYQFAKRDHATNTEHPQEKKKRKIFFPSKNIGC